MSSELVVVLKCDYVEIGKGTKAIPCKQLAVIKQCTTFVDYNEYTGVPFVALEYITPEGWMRVTGIAHFCPAHAELKRKQKYSLPDFEINDKPIGEEPTRRFKILLLDEDPKK